MTMEFTRRPASSQDRPFVEAANRRAYEELVVRQFGAWDDDTQARNFDEKWQRAGFEIVEVAGTPVGAIWTTDQGDHLRLREVFLLPEWQGRGLGSHLVRQELGKARRRCKPLRLSLLRMNRARSLYERLGFSVCGEEETKLWMQAV